MYEGSYLGDVSQHNQLLRIKLSVLLCQCHLGMINMTYQQLRYGHDALASQQLIIIQLQEYLLHDLVELIMYLFELELNQTLHDHQGGNQIGWLWLLTLLKNILKKYIKERCVYYKSLSDMALQSI